MRRKHGTKARLSFSGGPHAPVNMAESMENAGSWTVSGSKNCRRTLGFAKTWRAVRCSKWFFPHWHSLLPYFPPCFTGASLWCHARMFCNAGAWMQTPHPHPLGYLPSHSPWWSLCPPRARGGLPSFSPHPPFCWCCNLSSLWQCSGGRSPGWTRKTIRYEIVSKYLLLCLNFVRFNFFKCPIIFLFL